MPPKRSSKRPRRKSQSGARSRSSRRKSQTRRRTSRPKTSSRAAKPRRRLSSGQKALAAAAGIGLTTGAAKAIQKFREKDEAEEIQKQIPEEFVNLFPNEVDEDPNVAVEEVNNAFVEEPVPQKLFGDVVDKREKVVESIAQQLQLDSMDRYDLILASRTVLEKMINEIPSEKYQDIAQKCTENEKDLILKTIAAKNSLIKPRLDPLTRRFYCFREDDRPFFVEKFKERILFSDPNFEDVFRKRLLREAGLTMRAIEAAESPPPPQPVAPSIEEAEQMRLERERKMADLRKRRDNVKKMTRQLGSRIRAIDEKTIERKREAFENANNNEKLDQLEKLTRQIAETRNRLRNARANGDAETVLQEREHLFELNRLISRL